MQVCLSLKVIVLFAVCTTSVCVISVNVKVSSYPLNETSQRAEYSTVQAVEWDGAQGLGQLIWN